MISPFLQNFRQLELHRAMVQARVNLLPVCEQAAAIRETADAEHAAYPQYRSHWDGLEWQRYYVGRDIQTKGSLAFKSGDYVLAKKNTSGILFPPTMIAYSVRNGVDTHVNASDLIALTGDQ